jgi:hypothetical protein
MRSSTNARSAVPRQTAPTVRKSLAGFILLLALIASACGDHGFAADGTAAQRLSCMLGEEPNRVAKARRAGRSLPDAADACIAALLRTAQDGRLPELYRFLLGQLGGDARLTGKLPLVIGNAVLDGDGKVQIGNGKVMDVVPPSLAFDAGFTAAYLDRAGKMEMDPDRVKLKLLVEDCLDVKRAAGACFSAGFMYGAQAFRAQKASPD